MYTTGQYMDDLVSSDTINVDFILGIDIIDFKGVHIINSSLFNSRELLIFNKVLIETLMLFASQTYLDTTYEDIMEEFNSGIPESVIGSKVFNTLEPMVTVKVITNLMSFITKITLNSGDDILFIGWLKKGTGYDAGIVYV